ncbi:IS110 family transposase [Mesorhizobium sp. M0895]|uniref:IS110 family transposase n=1 Tax=Mesorhizobium sp. M0895 TaxID=2957019 RepID=UPI00333A2CBE
MPICSTVAVAPGSSGSCFPTTSGPPSPRDIARDAIDDPQVGRHQTITGVNAVVATGIITAIGDIHRFGEPQKLVSYFGLDPRVRQSGLGIAQYGRISKHGRSHHVPCWSRPPGRRRRRPDRSEPSSCASATSAGIRLRRSRSPAPRRVDLAHADEAGGLSVGEACVAGGEAATTRLQGRRAHGSAYAYNVKELRNREKAAAEHAERAYELMVRQCRQEGRSGARTPQRRNGYEGSAAALSSSGAALCHVVIRAQRI